MPTIICSRHENIINYSQDIYQLCLDISLTKDVDKIKAMTSQIKELSNKIHLEAEDAKKSGQRMEKRLRFYKDSIEEMGFIRYKQKE